MYIPDKHWDEIASEALELLENPSIILSPFVIAFIHTIINVDDQPIPRKKRKPLNSFQKIRKGRDLMRKLSRIAITRYAQKKISKIRMRKEKSKSFNKSPELVK